MSCRDVRYPFGPLYSILSMASIYDKLNLHLQAWMKIVLVNFSHYRVHDCHFFLSRLNSHQVTIIWAELFKPGDTVHSSLFIPNVRSCVHTKRTLFIVRTLITGRSELLHHS